MPRPCIDRPAVVARPRPEPVPPPDRGPHGSANHTERPPQRQFRFCATRDSQPGALRKWRLDGREAAFWSEKQHVRPTPRPAQIIDGKAVAADVKREVREATDRMVARGLRRPGLAVVLVGDDPASHIYVRNKRLACDECGFFSVSHDLPHSATQAELIALIERAERRRPHRRHPRAGAAAGPDRRARGDRRDRSRPRMSTASIPTTSAAWHCATR